MLRYAQIETAIASIHDIPPDAMKSFRSRIRNFQRIGLVPSSPGKGQKIPYTIENAIYWALCFQLADAGLPPNIIKTVMEDRGARLVRIIIEERSPVEDTYFVLLCTFLKWNLRNTPGKNLGQYTAGSLPMSGLTGVLANSPGVILINLTTLKRRLGIALGIEWE